MLPDQLSQTAAFIAIKFYGLTRMERYRLLFDHDVIRFYEQLVQSLPAPLNRYHSLLQNSWLRRFFICSEELLLPGDLMHILSRKYHIHRQIDQLLSEGKYRQLLVLGAGFDHLATYYSGKGVPVFELDAPRMADLKQEFIQEYGYQNEYLAIEPVLLSHDSLLNAMRKNPRLNPSPDTIIIAEGFFDYLNTEEVSGIIEDISLYFNNGIKIISTIFALDELPAFRRWVFKTGVRMVGEKIRLGLSKAEIRMLFEKKGFSIESVSNSGDMLRQLPGRKEDKLSTLSGFYLLRCEKK